MTDILECAFIIGSIAVLRRRAELARGRRAHSRADVYDALADEMEAELGGDDLGDSASECPSGSSPIQGDGGAAAEVAAG